MLVLIDICSAHVANEIVTRLDQVELESSPPNTTKKLQTLNTGIIATQKTRYPKMPYEGASDSLYDGKQNIYKIDQLTALKYSKSVW